MKNPECAARGSVTRSEEVLFAELGVKNKYKKNLAIFEERERERRKREEIKFFYNF